MGSSGDAVVKQVPVMWWCMLQRLLVECVKSLHVCGAVLASPGCYKGILRGGLLRGRTGTLLPNQYYRGGLI